MPEPNVRFKKDDGGSYPAWTAGKLGDITEKVDRKAPKGSTAPVMMVSQGNGFIYQADKYSRENAGQSLKNYTLLKQGEFAYNHGASKAKPYGVAYCLTEESEARVPFVYHTFRIADGVNPFWHEALNTSKMDRQLKRMVSSGARMDGLLNINYDTYMDVDVNIPCIEEQQKIADFLSSVDDVITTSEEEVANLKTQKKAAMKKIFSQEVRFKRADGSDFPEWEKRAIADVADLSGGKTPSMNNQAFWGNPVVNWVTSKDMKVDRISESEMKISPEAAETMRIYKSGTVLVVVRSGILKHTLPVAILDSESTINQDIKAFEIHGCEADFFRYFLKSQESVIIRDYVKKGTTVQSIQVDDMVKMELPIPCLEEQRLITDFLSDFDEAITAAKKELELWKELKKGLLQQMFV